MQPSLFVGQGAECGKPPVVVRCEAMHMRVVPHFFNPASGACKPWDFPNGACPNATFHTKAECEVKCRTPGAAQGPDCQRPSEERACDATEMKYPYIYTSELHRKGACIENLDLTYNHHRCHNSLNTFTTKEQCESLCYIIGNG